MPEARSDFRPRPAVLPRRAGGARSMAAPRGGQQVRHHRAHAEVANAISTVHATNCWPATALCFRVPGAHGHEIGRGPPRHVGRDRRSGATVDDPGRADEDGREHRVPLSPRALDVLAVARQFRGAEDIVFPSPSRKPLSDRTLSNILKRQGVNAVPHGFRSSFRDWGRNARTRRRKCWRRFGHRGHLDVRARRTEAAVAGWRASTREPSPPAIRRAASRAPVGASAQRHPLGSGRRTARPVERPGAGQSRSGRFLRTAERREARRKLADRFDNAVGETRSSAPRLTRPHDKRTVGVRVVSPASSANTQTWYSGFVRARDAA